MKKFTAFLIFQLLIFHLGIFAQSQMIANITEDVNTDFGTYHPYNVEITPQATQYVVEPDFSNVINFDHFTFNDNELEILRENGFVVKPGFFQQIHHVYNECYDMNTPVFVSTDAVLHTYHILYDYILRMLEVDQFVTDLDNLNKQMLSFTQEMYESTADSTAKVAAGNVLAYFSVADILLDENAETPSAVIELVQAELDLIDGHQGYDNSPIFIYLEDYSQYVPRGHYTRSDLLKSYFRSMMWLGRMTFAMDPDNIPELTTQQTLMALIITQALNSVTVAGEDAMAVWSRIYDPTVFFVGKSDDLNIYQYTEIAEQVYGENFTTLSGEELADSTLLDNFIEAASELSGPLSTSPLPGSTPKGFRFMGQRFIPDSYMFDRLTAPTVSGRLMPKGLDIMAVIGSPRAEEILDQVYDEYTNNYYVSWMDSLKTEFAEKPDSQWAQNLYWNWIYSLMPLLFPKDSGYPPFMQTVAWKDKELATSLGSWAELRHDTILYAKQSVSWESGPVFPSLLRGYVEPNPYLYARLAALTRFMLTGFENRGILLGSFENRLINLENLLLTLKNISEKELVNEIPTTDEYLVIQKIGHILENIITFPPEEAEQITNETDEHMAVIADVHTDALNNLVLEEGVGYPFDIYVIASIEDTLKITKGAVFSYYEFPWSISDRLTDEAWQEMLTGDSPQKPPVWTESFIDTSQSFLYEYLMPYNMADMYPETNNSKSTNFPEKFALYQNYPNPFNSSTTIEFSIPKRTFITLSVYDLQGRLVKILIKKEIDAGKYSIDWTAENQPSGMYLVKFTAQSTCLIGKIVLLK